MHIIAAKAVALKEALQPEFKEYQSRVLANARALASALQARGYRLVSGGTDNHLMLVDVKAKGITGKDAEKVLDDIGITVNKNTIPFDQESPFVTSGIRLGTPAVTTRGYTENDMETIAELIDEALTAAVRGTLDEVRASLRARVQELSSAYPLYRGA